MTHTDLVNALDQLVRDHGADATVRALSAVYAAKAKRMRDAYPDDGHGEASAYATLSHRLSGISSVGV